MPYPFMSSVSRCFVSSARIGAWSSPCKEQQRTQPIVWLCTICARMCKSLCSVNDCDEQSHADECISQVNPLFMRVQESLFRPFIRPTCTLGNALAIIDIGGCASAKTIRPPAEHGQKWCVHTCNRNDSNLPRDIERKRESEFIGWGHSYSLHSSMIPITIW